MDPRTRGERCKPAIDALRAQAAVRMGLRRTTRATHGAGDLPSPQSCSMPRTTSAFVVKRKPLSTVIVFPAIAENSCCSPASTRGCAGRTARDASPDAESGSPRLTTPFSKKRTPERAAVDAIAADIAAKRNPISRVRCSLVSHTGAKTARPADSSIERAREPRDVRLDSRRAALRDEHDAAALADEAERAGERVESAGERHHVERTARPRHIVLDPCCGAALARASSRLDLDAIRVAGQRRQRSLERNEHRRVRERFWFAETHRDADRAPRRRGRDALDVRRGARAGRRTRARCVPRVPHRCRRCAALRWRVERRAAA